MPRLPEPEKDTIDDALRNRNYCTLYICRSGWITAREFVDSNSWLSIPEEHTSVGVTGHDGATVAAWLATVDIEKDIFAASYAAGMAGELAGASFNRFLVEVERADPSAGSAPSSDQEKLGKRLNNDEVTLYNAGESVVVLVHDVKAAEFLVRRNDPIISKEWAQRAAEQCMKDLTDESDGSDARHPCDGCGSTTSADQLAEMVDNRLLCEHCSGPVRDSDPGTGRWLYPRD